MEAGAENVRDVRARVAVLDKQYTELRSVSAALQQATEDDQGAIRTMVRATRFVAEKLGVGPTPLPSRPGHVPGLAEEAEALATGVAHAWRRQKASGAIPAGAANLIDVLLLRPETPARLRRTGRCSESGGGGGTCRVSTGPTEVCGSGDATTNRDDATGFSWASAALC
eukprot:NODE_24197_length_634_cov_5.579882.p1 GENE.NODE_24197_length_634_cov_5.579882~~NODE_24197_length_634_cov_5.579882.p1  ORF type:complete len:169 (-),score=60.91 NODE_24197_length_634_cov_5.579882:100-606(-)